MLDSISVLMLLAAALAWLNAKFVRMSPSIVMMAAGIFASAILYGLASVGFPGIITDVVDGLNSLDFTSSLMNVVLGVLLYVTARRINFHLLDRQQYLVLGLAVASTLINTFLTGLAAKILLSLLGIELPLLHALLFGALISPTDPIATISILKRIGLPEKLEVIIEGESLFNDGVGAVVFSVLAVIAAGTSQPSAVEIGIAFVQEVGGGAILGAVLGYVAATAMAQGSVSLRFLVTLAVILFGGYLARSLHASYPLAMVVAGIMVAVCSVAQKAGADESAHMAIWSAIEEVLIAGLFLTIGLMALLPGQHPSTTAMLLIIPIVLFCRFISVAVPIAAVRSKSEMMHNKALFCGLLTWGGLRGGISIALALSLPPVALKMLLIDLTYAVVVFSVLIQAPTIRLLFPTTRLRKIVDVLN
jgi:CPA1 family monovalent cation:H+ antiporter